MHGAIDTSDRPFALPPRELITVMVDLPFPPSLNSIWRRSRKGVRISEAYKTWKKHADGLAMRQRVCRISNMITGPFTAQIYLCPGARRGDLDNLGKAVLDWAQSRNLIANDKHCQEVLLRWVEKERAPEGCRLILAEIA